MAGQRLKHCAGVDTGFLLRLLIVDKTHGQGSLLVSQTLDLQVLQTLTHEF